MPRKLRIRLTLLTATSILFGYTMARVVHGEATWILGILFGVDCGMTLGALWWAFSQRSILYKLAALSFAGHLVSGVLVLTTPAVECARDMGILAFTVSWSLAGFGSAWDSFKARAALDARTDGSDQ